MSLQINLQAPAKPFVARGPMPLVLSLRNTGDSGEEVPASIGPSQFEYLLLTENGEDTIENISYRTKELSRGHQLVLKPNLQLLAPGKATFYRNDLADLAIQPIGPGKYQVEALYRLPGNVLLRSNRVAIEVIASRPSQSIQGLDSRGANLDAFEFHNEDTGESVLRHWQSPLSNPLQGKFQHLHSVREPVSHLAMALEAEPQDSDMGQWRWVAWTSADTVCPEVARAVDVKYPAAGWQAACHP